MTGARGSGLAGGVVSGVLVLAMFYYGQAIFGPLVFSFFVIALAWPIQKRLERVMPQLLALLITLSLTVIVILAIASMVAWGFAKVGQWLFANGDRLQATYDGWTTWLEDQGLAIVGPLTERFDIAWLIGLAQQFASRLNSITGFAVLVFILVMLGLLEVESFKARMRLPAAEPYGEKILEASREFASKLQRYMVVRSLASVLTGLFVWGFAHLVGLELASAWGAIAFALNYIPFLGPLISTLFPTFFSFTQYDVWYMPVFIFLVLNLIQFIIGSYFEPILAGARLSISPFAVLFAVFFWSFMWGLAGAFIGVPILIAFVTFCTKWPSSLWIAILLSGGSIEKMAGRPPG